MTTLDAPDLEEAKATGLQSGVAKTAPQGLLGRVVDGRYQVEALLGEGGMGLVYRVTHTRLNKSLAMKVLRRENTEDEEVLARFRREAEAASAIGNQHIVDVSDFGTLEDGSTYIVMECLEGMDLIEAMDIVRRMPEPRALDIAAQVCKALGAAHDAGIVHRDLKPENIYLIKRDETEDFVKVLDFGIAKVAHGPTRLTRQGEVLGTPHYMSPEQCEGENVDHRTDIYALGVLLYEMLTGQVPHDADTLMGILTKHLYEDPIPPKVRTPEVSEELEKVVMRCLDKDPAQRYSTMRELEADLARIKAGQRPVGPDTLTLTPTRPPAGLRRRISPVYLGGLGVALLALLGVLVVGATRKSPDPRPAALASPSPQTPVTIEVATPTVTEQDVMEDVLEEPAAEADAPEERAPSAAAKTPRRKPRARPRPSPRHDPAILDPWN